MTVVVNNKKLKYCDVESTVSKLLVYMNSYDMMSFCNRIIGRSGLLVVISW